MSAASDLNDSMNKLSIQSTEFLDGLSINPIIQYAPLGNRKTKIICTLGPATHSLPIICDLLRAGMNIARLNFSHGSHEYHKETIQLVREASKATSCPVAIMLDTKGPEIRTTKLVGHAPIELSTGQKLVLKCTEDVLFEGTKDVIGVDYINLPNVVEIGSDVKIDDGLITCKVIAKSLEENTVTTIVANKAEIGENKGVNLPNTVVDLPPVTEKDKADIAFGVENGIDFIAASFARRRSGIEEIRTLLGEKGKRVQIIAKIENVEGLDNFDAILDAADGIMVARGDLGVEIPIQKVCMAQKMMIHKCLIAGKPVVTATQMLESMIKNPRPTRAEASDIANAVFDGSDAVMLSGETAKGAFPLAAVRTMANICVTAELALDYRSMYLQTNALRGGQLSRPEAVTSAAVKVVNDLNASLIIVLTNKGGSSTYVAKNRPPVPVLCVTQDPIYRALYPLLSDKGGDAYMVEYALRIATQNQWVKTGDWVVVISGTEGIAGSAHTLKVVNVL